MDRVKSSARRVAVVRTIAAILGACALGGQASADEASDVRGGQELAAKFCSPCHAIAEKPGPSFVEIAKGERAAPEALRAFLHSTASNVSHPGAMPNPELSEKQIDEIAAYLASLRAAH